MLEKTIPWWRKALNFAMGGIRSGFGLFPRTAEPEPVTEPKFSGSLEKAPEEETALIDPSSQPEIVVAAPAIPAEPVAEDIPAVEPDPSPEPAPSPEPSGVIEVTSDSVP